MCFIPLINSLKCPKLWEFIEIKPPEAVAVDKNKILPNKHEFYFPAKISREIVTMNRYDCRASPPHVKAKRASSEKRASSVNRAHMNRPLQKN